MTNYSGTAIGRYHLLEPLGRGGMAVVYRGYDTRLERGVAVKLIRMEAFPPEVYDRILARFEREAKSLAGMIHAHIVKVHDYGEYQGSPYLVMELLEGGTLKERLGQPVPVVQAARLLAPVADALAYAHRHGILHRDVKPSNILITYDGQVVLADFGIAKLMEGKGGHTLTGTGMGVGTPEYMAPEQGLGGEVDARADMYSLGVVLYELLTGRKPYVAETPMAVILKQVHDPLPRPRNLVPDLPEMVEQLLLKMLAKQPQDRYQEMDVVASMLRRLAGMAEAGVVEGKSASALRKAYGRQDGRMLQHGEAETRDMHEMPRQQARSFTGSAAKDRRKRKRWMMVGGTLGLLLIGVVIISGFRTDFFRAHTAPGGPMDVQTRVREVDGMVEVYVPAGRFLMGSTGQEPDADGHETPQHAVSLDAFWIDQTEVTNGKFAACVDANVCTLPENTTSFTRSSYYGTGIHTNFPVVHVTWEQAQTYCTWAGGRLPTEAEWEKAARGEDGWLYPWGIQSPDCSLANYRGCEGDTARVGRYPDAASPYGALDMAGNVWEWVADRYALDYYEHSPEDNPAGPESGSYRVLRGGSWDYFPSMLRAAARLRFAPGLMRYDIGFRCVRLP